MLTMLLRHLSYLRMVLRWFHNSLSGPGVEELLQLSIAHLNSSLEREFQNDFSLFLISSRTLMSTWQLRAVLKVKWRAFHKELRVRHGWLLYLITSIASNLHLLTQLISFQGPWLLLAISWILVLKKVCLVNFEFDQFLKRLLVLDTSYHPILV